MIMNTTNIVDISKNIVDFIESGRIIDLKNLQIVIFDQSLLTPLVNYIATQFQREQLTIPQYNFVQDLIEKTQGLPADVPYTYKLHNAIRHCFKYTLPRNREFIRQLRATSIKYIDFTCMLKRDIAPYVSTNLINAMSLDQIKQILKMNALDIFNNEQLKSFHTKLSVFNNKSAFRPDSTEYLLLNHLEKMLTTQPQQLEIISLDSIDTTNTAIDIPNTTEQKVNSTPSPSKLISDISERLNNFAAMGNIRTDLTENDLTNLVPMLNTPHGNISVISMVNYFSMDQQYGLNVPYIVQEINKFKPIIQKNISNGKFMLSEIIKFDGENNPNTSISKLENAYYFLVSMLTYIISDQLFVGQDPMTKYYVLSGIRQYTRIFLESTVNLIKKYQAMSDKLINIHHDLMILYKVLTAYGLNLGLSYDELNNVYMQLNDAFNTNMQIYQDIIENNMVELLDPNSLRDLELIIAELKNKISMLREQHKILIENKVKLSNTLTEADVMTVSDINLKNILNRMNQK